MRTALLVIDMQNFFSDMFTPEVISNITQLVLHFRQLNLLVIFTQHGHTLEELLPPYYGGNQLVWKWGPEGSIKRGSKEGDFLPEIDKLVGCSPAEGSPLDSTSSAIVVAKNTYDAFINTSLASVLEERHVS